MVQNSKEGTSSAKMYDGNSSRVNGYYYTYDQAAGACPTGWHLPTSAEWETLKTWVNANKADNAAAFWITAAGNAFAGARDLNNDVWGGWRTHGHWWSASAASQNYFADITSTNGMLGPITRTGFWMPVRCVKN